MYSIEFEKRFKFHDELPVPLKPQKKQKIEEPKVSEASNVKESILSSSYNAFKSWSSDLAKSKLSFTSSGFSLTSALNKITKPKSRINVEYHDDCRTPTFKPPVRRSTSSLNLYNDDYMNDIVGSFREGSGKVSQIKTLGSLNDISYYSETTTEAENEIPMRLRKISVTELKCSRQNSGSKYVKPPNIDMNAPIGERPPTIGAELSLEAEQSKINCSETFIVPERYGRLSLDSQKERIHLSSSLKESLDLSCGPPIPPPRSKRSSLTKLRSTSDLNSYFNLGQDISNMPSKIEKKSSEPVKPARSKKPNNLIVPNKPTNAHEKKNKDLDDENSKQKFDELRTKLSNRIQLKQKTELNINLNDMKNSLNLKNNNNNEPLKEEKDAQDQAMSSDNKKGFSKIKRNNSKVKTKIPKPPDLPSMTKPTKIANGGIKCKFQSNAACKIESSQINQSPKRPQRKKITKNAPELKDSNTNNKSLENKRIPTISDLNKCKMNLKTVECPKPPIRKSSIGNRNEIPRPKSRPPPVPGQSEVKL